MTYKQIQLMQNYLVKQGYTIGVLANMGVSALIDLYYEERGVRL